MLQIFKFCKLLICKICGLDTLNLISSSPFGYIFIHPLLYFQQDIQEAHAGQIVAVFGIDCASGFPYGQHIYLVNSIIIEVENYSEANACRLTQRGCKLHSILYLLELIINVTVLPILFISPRVLV